jgi:hypothetical protein
MIFKPLDVVVLQRDYPKHGLKRGDLGAVVDVHEPDGLEVEFVTASGQTEALVMLSTSDVRAVARNDLVAVRTYTGAA